MKADVHDKVFGFIRNTLSPLNYSCFDWHIWKQCQKLARSLAADLFRLFMSFLPALVSNDSSKNTHPQNKSNQPNHTPPKITTKWTLREIQINLSSVWQKQTLCVSVVRSVTSVAWSFCPFPKKYILSVCKV